MLEVLTLGMRLADGVPDQVAIFPVGVFKTHKYPRVDLSDKRVARILDNFANKILHRDIRIDADHEFAEAAGWITALSLGTYADESTGDERPAVIATVEWTPQGAQMLADKTYRYFSAAIGDYKDPDSGTVTKDVLLAVSLTNDPVLPVPAAGAKVTLLGQTPEVVLALSEAELLGEVVDELRRQRREIMPNEDTPELRAARWGTWPALCALDKLIGEAITEGVTGEDLRARIAELTADLPDAIAVSIEAEVERANEGPAEVEPVEVVPQVDPLATLADAPSTDDLLAQYDTLMDSLADHIKGAKGVRMARELAKATRSKLADILGQKGVTEKMSEPTKEELELSERARQDAETKLAAYQRKEREGNIDALKTALAAKGVAQPAIDMLVAMATAEDTSAILLSEGGETVDMTGALAAFATALAVVPVEPRTAVDVQPDAVVELSATERKLCKQLSISEDDMKAAKAAATTNVEEV